MGDILGGTGAPAQGYLYSQVKGDTTIKDAPGYVHTVTISPVMAAGAPLPYVVQLLDGATQIMEWTFAGVAATAEASNLSHCTLLDVLIRDSIEIVFIGGTTANVCVTYM